MKNTKKIKESITKIDKKYFESLKDLSKAIVIMDFNKKNVLYLNNKGKKLTLKEFGNRSHENILKIKDELMKINKFKCSNGEYSAEYEINENLYGIVWKNIIINKVKVVLIQAEDISENKNNKLKLEQMVESNAHVKMALEGLLGLIENNCAAATEKKYLKRIQLGCDYLKMIIENEMNIKKSSNSNDIVKEENVDLNKWVEEYILATEESIKSKNVELIFQNKIQKGMYSIDKVKLGRIIGIVINNSINKSSVDAKVIVFKMATYKYSNNSVVLAMELNDKAIEIDDDIVKFINEEQLYDNEKSYEKLKRSYNAKIIKKIIDLMNGRIKIDKNGKKAKIRIMIKCNKAINDNAISKELKNKIDYPNGSILKKLA